ncbi:EAL domain-containing protein [Pseudolysobacter antarcticus]|uniref:cyclic-guanylate-specific phosphodiesterase n=1 Tax=Pseudolysobacter antarcticus TaxID=2511995 RepID=A0A411HNR2_9GAMM|nr:EAL domain-containing protein [Pseudolysobacter antarcticus]QBB72128.1 EAL domain-containing protein [Pseudolysobacter antarcticus]
MTISSPSRQSALSSADTIARIKALIGQLEIDDVLRAAIEFALGEASLDPASGDSNLLSVLHQTLDALRESNRRFHDMLDNVELISVILSPAGTITFCNDYLLQLTGWARNDLLGKNWFEMFVPPELALHKVHSVLLTGATEPRHHINEIVTRWGERRIIQWNNSLLRSAAGEVTGTVSIGADVTERVQREQDLQRFRLVMDATADAIYLVDRISMRVIDVNGAACRMLGYDREEILALSPEQIYSFDREQLMRNWDRLIELGNAADIIETSHLRKDGSWVQVEVERRAVRTDDNSWIIVGVARDISLRKQAEDELRFQALLLNTVGEALVASDRLGNIRYWNAQAEQLYGWSASEVIGQNMACILFTDPLHEFAVTILPEVSQGQTWRGENAAQRKDGTRLYVQLSVAPVQDAAKQLTGLICVSRDISKRRATERALRRSNERFELVTRATNDIVWDWDVSTDTLWWSENMGSTLGYDRLDLDRGMESWYEPLHPDDYERVEGGVQAAIDSDAVSWQDEYRFRHNDGHYLAIFDRGFVIRDKSGKAIRMIGAMMDITARKKAEIENRQHAMQQSLLAEFGQKALASTNLDTIMDEAAVVVAKGLEVEFCRAMQLSADGTSLIFKAGCGWNDRWLRRSVPLNDPEARKRYELHLHANGPIVIDDFSTETRFVPSSTLTDHQIASAVEVLIRGPSGIYGLVGAYSRERSAFSPEKVNFLRSISITLGTAVERVRSDERVAYLAQFDTLTGLPNRHLFHDRMAQTLSQAERNNWYAGVVYIDVDRFKIVNDTYGHAIGDALLTEVAQRLRNCIRSGDTVGRLGGDEFAIVLSDLANVYDANTVAQKILDALAQPFKLDAYETYVTASLGISLYPSDGIDADTLLKNADTAMYRAKEQGRNNFEFYTPVLNQRATRRIGIERELRHAIELNQLELFYQPQISLENGQIVAAEALIRWRHPQRGLLGPSEFIGIAEESGLIVPIGQWVVETACTQTMLWHQAGHSALTIAVNVSPAEIRRGNVPEQIRAALDRSGLKPQNFEVEITESMAMDSAESFIDTLRTLKNVGVMIAIDDFGTGYSNLSYLKRFPIDTIKIDQTFIRDIVTDTDDAVIVRAIIAMAHQLKLDVVAEGVETEAQATFLRRNQIDLVQGFLFSAAIDANAFGQLLDRRKSGQPQFRIFPTAP